MEKVVLNKDVRIKRDENYFVLDSIRKVISNRINAEYLSETSALQKEVRESHDQESKFIEDVRLFLKGVNELTPLKISVQVGPGSTIIHQYTGFLEKKVGFGDKWFNFTSKERDNECKPFTVGFSCLQSIEINEPF